MIVIYNSCERENFGRKVARSIYVPFCSILFLVRSLLVFQLLPEVNMMIVVEFNYKAFENSIERSLERFPASTFVPFAKH